MVDKINNTYLKHAILEQSKRSYISFNFKNINLVEYINKFKPLNRETMATKSSTLRKNQDFNIEELIWKKLITTFNNIELGSC